MAADKFALVYGYFYNTLKAVHCLTPCIPTLYIVYFVFYMALEKSSFIFMLLPHEVRVSTLIFTLPTVGTVCSRCVTRSTYSNLLSSLFFICHRHNV